MTVVTISRGSYSMGKQVAERTAERLGYECVSREVLLEASDQFNIPEIKLVKALKDTPSILERFTHGRSRYVAYIQSALTKHVEKDDVVYHGFAGHLLLKNVSHVMKVLIMADLDRRIDILMNREGVGKREALSWISKIDNDRRRWSKRLYGADPWDPALYDMVIKVHTFDLDDAVDMICQSTSLKHFKATPESKRRMEDLALACKVKADLIRTYPDVFVASDYGNILIYSNASERNARDIRKKAESLRGKVEGINNVEIHIGVSPPESAI